MDYKLIALDISRYADIFDKKEITPRTRYALMEAQKQGKKIILASGRHPVGIMPIAKDLMLDRFGGFIMAFNGGRIINCETGETMVSKLFPYLPDIANVFGKDSNITMNTYYDRKLKKRKTYYIRVRAYKMNGKKKVYGKWSTVKKVKIKK